MRILTRTLAFTLALIFIPAVALSQRPRSTATDETTTPTTMPKPPAAPATVKAKYEGGVFGFNKKQDGTLSFDDGNERLVFRDDKGKELFPIPYKSISGAAADTHRVQPAAATVASHVPYVGLPASLIKTKVRYLTVQYNDPDSKVSGVTSFRLENKDILDSVLYTLATKAGLSQRGEIFIRKEP
jgi:hypothetical protein